MFFIFFSLPVCSFLYVYNEHLRFLPRESLRAICSSNTLDALPVPSRNGSDALQQVPAPASVILVTYAQYEPFLSSQRNLIASQLALDGSVDDIQAWTVELLHERFPNHSDVWGHEAFRPGCAAFKPVVVRSAMVQAKEADWVIWADSSKHYTGGIHSNMKDFVRKLEELGVDSFPATALCGISNVDNGCVSAKTFRDMDLDLPRYWFSPHFQNNFFAFKVNKRNLAFMLEWEQYMLNIDVACGSRVHDQAIFSLLVAKYELKFLSLCDFGSTLHKPHYHELKNVDFVISRVMQMDKSSVMHSQDQFLRLWRNIQWAPACAGYSATEQNLYAYHDYP